jgi:hypothetical protein
VLFVGMRLGCQVVYRWRLFIAAARCPACCQCRCPALLASSAFSFPCPLHRIGVGPPPPRHSTSNPPHEQLLVRLGAGGVLFLRRVVPSPTPVIALTPPSRSSTYNPPHEQLLVRLEAGDAWGCGRGRGRLPVVVERWQWQLMVVVVVVHPVSLVWLSPCPFCLCLPISHIHPASTCSQPQWGRPVVVCPFIIVSASSFIPSANHPMSSCS